MGDIGFGRSRDVIHDYRGASVAVPMRSIVRDNWTTDDTKKAILFSLIPGGVALTAFGALAKDKNVLEFWKKCRKPSWAPEDTRLYSVMDLLTMAPLGYATYLVYKNGGIEYSDTRAALGLYGANVVLQLATIPLIKKRDMNCLFWNTALTTATAAAAAYAYYKIDHTAGLMLLPYTLWSGFYTFLSYAVCDQNKPGGPSATKIPPGSGGAGTLHTENPPSL